MDMSIVPLLFDGLKNNRAQWDVIGASLYPSLYSLKAFDNYKPAMALMYLNNFNYIYFGNTSSVNVWLYEKNIDAFVHLFFTGDFF